MSLLFTYSQFITTEPTRLPPRLRSLDLKVGDGRAIDVINSDFLTNIPRGEPYRGACTLTINPIRTPLLLDARAYNTTRVMETVAEDANLAVRAELGVHDIIRSCNGGVLISDAFSQDTILADHNTLLKSHGGSLTDEQRAKFNAEHHYPTYPCEAVTYKGFDGAGLVYLNKHARAVTLLSATLLEGHLLLLNGALGMAVNHFRIEIPKYRPIGDVALINALVPRGYISKVHASKSSHKDPVNKLASFPVQVYHTAQAAFEKGGGCTLVVFATKARMVEAFDQITEVVEHPHVAKFDQGEYRSESHDGSAALIVSYAGSALARGIDLGQCKQVFMDGEILKPILSYPDIGKDVNYEQLFTADMTTCLTQIAGRIFRTEKDEDTGRPRAVGVFNATSKVFKALGNNIERQITGKLHRVTLAKLNKAEKYALGAMYPTLAVQQAINTVFGYDGGELDVAEMAGDLAKLRREIKKPYDKLRRYVREHLSPGEYKTVQFKVKTDELFEKIEALAVAGFSWRECCRKLNMNRKIKALEGVVLEDAELCFKEAKKA